MNLISINEIFTINDFRHLEEEEEEEESLIFSKKKYSYMEKMLFWK